MNRYLLGCLAIIVALAVSCKEKEEKPTPVDPPTPSGSVSLVGDMTKLGTLQPVWSAEDCIAVFHKDGAPVAFSLSGEGGGSVASFSGELTGIAQGDTIYACHPYIEECSRKSVPIDLSNQEARPGIILPADITVASGIVEDVEEMPALVFEHILGGLNFTLDNQGIIARTVSSVGIISEGIVLGGTYNFISGELTANAETPGKSVLSFTNESAAAKGKTSWVLSVIPQTLPEGTKAFVERAPGDTLIKTLSRTVIKKGKMLDLSFTLEFEGLNVNSVIEPFVSETDPSVTKAVAWNASDIYGVFSGEKNTNVPFSLISGDKTAEALFLGYPDVNIDDAMQAYYPYSENISAAGIINIDLTNQEIRANGPFAPMDIAVAQAKVGTENNMTFKHVLGGILVEVSNISEKNSLVVNEIGISFNNVSLKGTYNVINGELSPEAASEGKTVCTTGRTILAGKKELFFFSVIPQEITAGTLIAIETSTGKILEATVPETVTVEAGKYIMVSIEDEGERVGLLKDIGSCQYDVEGSVMWTSPALSLDGQVAYVTSSNYKIAAIPLEGGKLASTPAWVCDAKEAGMAAGGNSVTATPAVGSTGIYALLGKGTKASLVKVLPNGTLDFYRWASYYVNGNTTNPDPESVQFEFDLECPIIFPSSDVYAERVMFSMQANGDYKRFVTARGCGNPNGNENERQGGSRQTSKGTTTNLGGILGYVGSDGWYFLAGRTGSSAIGAQVIKTNTNGGSMSGSSTASQLIGYVKSAGAGSNGRGSQMAQDENYDYYTGWNPAMEQYPGGSTLLFRYPKSKIKASSEIEPDYIVALKGGVSPSASSGLRGVGSVLSADGSVLYVTTCETSDESAYVHAVKTADGSVIWSYEAQKMYGVAAVDDLGYVYFNDYGTGELIQLDPQTGVALEKISLGEVRSSPTIGPGGIIYCNTLNQEGKPTLRAFSISQSQGPAKGWSQLGGNPQKSGKAY